MWSPDGGPGRVSTCHLGRRVIALWGGHRESTTRSGETRMTCSAGASGLAKIRETDTLRTFPAGSPASRVQTTPDPPLTWSGEGSAEGSMGRADPAPMTHLTHGAMRVPASEGVFGWAHLTPDRPALRLLPRLQGSTGERQANKSGHRTSPSLWVAVSEATPDHAHRPNTSRGEEAVSSATFGSRQRGLGSLVSWRRRARFCS